MTGISYDQMISEFIDARMQSDGAAWKQAAIAYFLKTHMSATGKQVASDTGYSGRYINQLVKTFSAFPEEDDRAHDMSFSTHLKCAETDDPVGWLDRAVAEGWSVRQLDRAIKEGKPDKDEVEVAQLIWDKLTAMLEAKGEGAAWLRLRLTELQLNQL